VERRRRVLVVLVLVVLVLASLLEVPATACSWRGRGPSPPAGRDDRAEVVDRDRMNSR
jgi:hypothetical protein